MAAPDTSRVLSAMLSTPEQPVPLIVMDGVGHTPMEEDPDVFVDIVRKYV